MTKEEAIKMAEARLQCLINETSGIGEICSLTCEECQFNYAQGNLGEQKEWVAIAISAMKKDSREEK